MNVNNLDRLARRVRFTRRHCVYTYFVLLAIILQVSSAMACELCSGIGLDPSCCPLANADTTDELPPPYGEFRITGRVSDTATDGSTGSVGTPINLTWSIVPDGTDLFEAGEPDSPSNLIATLGNIFGGPTTNSTTGYQGRPWFSVFAESFDRLSQVAGVTYIYEPNDDGIRQHFSGAGGVTGVRGDVRIGGHSIDGNTGANTLGFNFFPDFSDMVLDTDNTAELGNASNNYRLFRNLIMHEAGHGLGLLHVESNTDGFLMEPFISTAFDGPQFDDILGLHRNYGDALEKNGGNDTPATATQLGNLGLAQSRSLGTMVILRRSLQRILIS